MNRRAFFSGLAGLVACATLDPEELLWKPTKTIFVPPFRPDPLYDQIDATTLEALRMNVIFTNLFRDTPIEGYVRQTLLEPYVVEVQHPFLYNTSLELP